MEKDDFCEIIKQWETPGLGTSETKKSFMCENIQV